jgi:hypothetical protein
MMRGSAFILALVSFAACGATKSDSMVVVTVTAPATLVSVTQLRVTVSNAGSTEVEFFPETNTGVPISFSNSFALSLSKSRQGDLSILVEGLDAISQVMASGSGTARIAVGGRADITIDLSIPGTTPGVRDSGPPGSGGAGGEPDAGTGTRWDALGMGGSSGHDGPVTTGTGGIVGTGGVRGTGGTGSGGTPGTGGIFGAGGSPGHGGASGTGGRTGSGGIPGTGGVFGTGGNGTSTGGSTGGGTKQCAPKTATTPAITSTGGLSCPGGLCAMGTYAGYLYVYSDGTSTICAGPDNLCASGTTGAADTTGKIWGAGVGINLDKADPPPDVQLSGTGMTYALSSLPTQGMRAQVSVGSKDYCVKLTSASGTVAWTDFNTACWDNSGTKLTGAPKTPHIGFQVTAATAAGTFDFCVTKVSF